MQEPFGKAYRGKDGGNDHCSIYPLLCYFRGAAKASGSLDPASPSGISEEDENFSFPLTPPSEPAAPAAVFSSWHSFRKRSSKARPRSPHAYTNLFHVRTWNL